MTCGSCPSPGPVRAPAATLGHVSTPPADAPADAAAARPPVPLVLACAVLALQVVALVVSAVVFLLDMVRGLAPDVVATLVLTVFFLGLAALLAGAARALWRGRRWGRAPVLTVELLLAASAIALADALPTPAVVVVVASAAVAVAGVLARRSREHTDRGGVPSFLA